MPPLLPGYVRVTRRSDHLVQPADRRPVTRLAVGLELCVPVAAEQAIHPEGELRAGGGREQRAQAVLPHEHVAVDAGGGAEDAEVRRDGGVLSVAARTRLLGHLVAQDAPAA